MFNEKCALNQLECTPLYLYNKNGSKVEIPSRKLKKVLNQSHCFPNNFRKELWSQILQLPFNEKAFKTLVNCPQFQQTKNQYEQKFGKKTLTIANALIHWHAPLLGCDWLPFFVQQIAQSFGGDLLFCFEVSMTILTNIFSEWISDICSPPPKVLTRIDTIFLYYNPKLRDSLNNPLIIWPLYRSLFSELLYNTNWLELMDFIICSSPQFIEFLVIAWVELNINQILIDPNTFHSTKRTIITKQLIKKAQNIINKCPTTLLTHKQFQPLNKDSYPIIKCNYNSMILRSLQTDQDKLTKLQSKILKQRKESEEIEKLKAKRKQTMETIQQLYHMREEEERIKTIKEINSLNEQLKQLKLESKRLRIINEKQFLEDWDKDWDSTFDDIIRGKIKMFPKRLKNDNQIENDGIRFQSLANQRNLDLEIRNARKESVNRNNVKKFELETKNNQRMMENEFLKLENPPKLIVDV